MADSLQLLHLTDMHLRADTGARLHGWAVERAFSTVLKAALARYPHYDALVLGGDLVDDESSAGYRRLNARLHALGRPVLAMAGNHDDPQRMARLLTFAQVHGPLAIGGWRLYALDSHQPGSEAGRLGAAQLAGLERWLQADTAPAIVFVHHPPVSLGSAWIDAIGLQEGAALGALLARYPRVRGVVCGHGHQAAHLKLGPLDCWLTPATMRQFLPGAATFAEDIARAPGYRWLALGVDGQIETRVERVPNAGMACG